MTWCCSRNLLLIKSNHRIAKFLVFVVVICCFTYFCLKHQCAKNALFKWLSWQHPPAEHQNLCETIEEKGCLIKVYQKHKHHFCAPPLNHTSYVSLNVLHQFHKVTALQIFQPGNNKLLNNCGNYCRIKWSIWVLTCSRWRMECLYESMAVTNTGTFHWKTLLKKFTDT